MNESNRQAKECITRALFLLMQKKAFEEITVTEICQLAGYNRVTYYRNFSAKHDILQQKLDDIILSFQATMKLHRGEHFVPTATRMFRLAGEHSEIVLLMLKAGFYQSVLMGFERAFQHTMPNSFSSKATYYRAFHAGGYFGLISSWLISGMKETPEEMGATLAEIMDNATTT